MNCKIHFTAYITQLKVSHDHYINYQSMKQGLDKYLSVLSNMRCLICYFIPCWYYYKQHMETFLFFNTYSRPALVCDCSWSTVAMVAAVNLTQHGVTFGTQQIVDLLLKVDHFLNKEHVNDAVNCLLQ